MNAPFSPAAATSTPTASVPLAVAGEGSDLVDRARLTARRLKAAARQPGWYGRRAREIGGKLAWERRNAERAVLAGPYPHLTGLHRFLVDWRHAIDCACKPARLSSLDLNNLRKGAKAFPAWEQNNA